MLIKQDAGMRQFNFLKKSCMRLFLLLCVTFIYSSHTLYGDDTVGNGIFKNVEASKDKKSKNVQCTTQTYYLYIADFGQSFIEIVTAPPAGSSTIQATYLAGRAPIYNKNNQEFGTCSASFLCMQTADGIFTDISNFLSIDNGLIVSWFTPSTLINLEIDNFANGMVTECMVTATTKVGVNPFYGQTFNLVVSSDNEKIYFEFTRTGTIF